MLAKQMKILYMDDYNSEQERRNYIPAIHQNILSNVKDILWDLQALEIELPPEAQVLHYEYVDFF
jgi:hypothetical protein